MMRERLLALEEASQAAGRHGGRQVVKTEKETIITDIEKGE